MKKWLLLAMFLPTMVRGQTICYDGNGNLMQVQGDPSLKALFVTEQSPSRDYVKEWTNIINGKSITLGSMDSTGTIPIDVHAYRHLKLLLRVNTSLRRQAVRLAFQFREHSQAMDDSSHTYAEYTLGKRVVSATLNPAADTTVTGHLQTGAALVPWSGEYVIEYDCANRMGDVGGTTILPSAVPAGIAISLDKLLGEPARFDQLSIRIRNLGSVNGVPATVWLSMKGWAE